MPVLGAINIKLVGNYINSTGGINDHALYKIYMMGSWGPSPPPLSPRSWLGADPSALALLLYLIALGMGASPPLPITPPLCPPPPQGVSLPPPIIRGALSVLGTCRRRLSGPRPQNAEVLRSGHCVCPRHTGFGLSLARVAAPTPAASSPPVTYGVRPVPVPCDRARPCVLSSALRRVATTPPIFPRLG